MRQTTWVPAVIAVGEQDGGEGMSALVLSDAHETVVVPLGAGDARRIGIALLGLEIPDTLDTGEHNESCSSLAGRGWACDCLHGDVRD